MPELLGRHRPMLDAAVSASQLRGFRSPYPKIPSKKIYGENVRAAAV